MNKPAGHLESPLLEAGSIGAPRGWQCPHGAPWSPLLDIRILVQALTIVLAGRLV
jgi:hypothetical protein